MDDSNPDPDGGALVIGQDQSGETGVHAAHHKDCEFCHPPDSRKLTPAGEYFRDHGDSLKGYQPPEQDNKKAAAKPAK
jgi:hypothetical protein